MKNDYLCDICGCYMDPGKDRFCDECQTDHKKLTSAETMIEMLRPNEYQCEMEECVNEYYI